jgi:hypothetical protein
MASQGALGFGGEQFVHGSGLLFSMAAAHVGPDGLRGNVLCGAMQPAGKHRAVSELPGIFCEGDEYALGHILGEM